MKFGITLSNRGILLGLTTVPKLLALANAVERYPLLDSVWVGAWGAIGTPEQCASWIRRFQGTGCQGFTLRLATMGDAAARLQRLTGEVLPLS